MNFKYLGIFFTIILFSCSDMNESIDQYLSQGEIIYIAKSDSVKTFAGKNRFLVDFWMSDPRVTEMRIYWSQRKDSILINIQENRNIRDSISVYVNSLKEGNYTLNFVSYDIYGNKSIPDEYIVNVYGEKFASTLSPRFIKSTEYIANDKTLKISFGGLISQKECGINVFYKNINGKYCKDFYDVKTLKNTVSIKDLDISESVSYETLYVPEPTAIDTFYTPKKIIELQ